ncbi:MAG: FAD-dependent oxidoreductase [Spirochaeta sp.]|jgi:NADH dehydrogenase FAD-containing subunit|nr:FAD-dependent oxidoreductase [Spirochaeta sp.]
MKDLLLLGAGHAHLKTIHAIPVLHQHGVRVVVVDPAPHLYYSGSISGIVGGMIAPRGGTIDTRAIVERNGGRFVEAAAIRIDPNDRTVALSDGNILSWDVLSCAVGSHSETRFTVDEAAADRVIPVKPVRDVSRFDRPFLDYAGTHPCHIVVLGGGATAVEIAGNMVRRARLRGSSCQVSVVTRSAQLLPGFHPAAGKIAEAHLDRLGVAVHVNSSVTRVGAGKIILADGSTRAYDYVIPATGLGVPSVFADSGLPVAKDGALRVNRSLQVSGYPIFGGGDCISFAPQELARVGVHAVYQAQVIYENALWAAGDTGPMDGKEPPASYTPPDRMLQILNLGDGTGLAIRGSRVRVGRLWLALKERIDWGYVRSGGARLRPSVAAPPREMIPITR